MTGSRRPERANRLNYSQERHHLHPWWRWQELRGQPRCAGARTRMAFLQGNGEGLSPAGVCSPLCQQGGTAGETVLCFFSGHPPCTASFPDQHLALSRTFLVPEASLFPGPSQCLGEIVFLQPHLGAAPGAGVLSVLLSPPGILRSSLKLSELHKAPNLRCLFVLQKMDFADITPNPSPDQLLESPILFPLSGLE